MRTIFKFLSFTFISLACSACCVGVVAKPTMLAPYAMQLGEYRVHCMGKFEVVSNDIYCTDRKIVGAPTSPMSSKPNTKLAE